MIQVQEAVRSLLLANATIDSYLNDAGQTHVYPNIAPEFRADEHIEQYIAYEVITRTRSRDLRGPERLAQTRIQVDVYARSYSVAHTLAEAVGSATDGFRGEVTTVNGSVEIASIEMTDIQDLYEESGDARETAWYRVSMDLVVWHEIYTPVVAQR